MKIDGAMMLISMQEEFKGSRLLIALIFYKKALTGVQSGPGISVNYRT